VSGSARVTLQKNLAMRGGEQIASRRTEEMATADDGA